MTDISFAVQGNPIPKQSTRIASTAGSKKRFRTYPDPKVCAWQDAISWSAKEAMQGNPPIEEDVAVILLFYRENRYRVDLDNLSKAVLDGMNDIVFKDDKQVVELHLFKRYDKEHPRVQVHVDIIRPQKVDTPSG